MSHPTNEERSPQRVVCAALQNVYREIICGARHFDGIMCMQILKHKGDWRQAEQGFIDQFGTFLSREEAYKIAREQGQILNELDHSYAILYSEHLY